jgi:Tol biopolymer transport system component
MTLAPGARLGAYEIVAPLGAGGMGEVYRARDARVGREVAVKVLPSEYSSDPERLMRFEQEARASAALNHPNILALFDVGQHNGAPFIVTELLEGQTLRERLSGGSVPVRKAIDFAIQIAQGLAAAHEKGIVHRDLKPENVFITSDGRAKILDFGLAKLTQPEPALSGISVLPTTPPQTTPGVVLGTIGYMSPEQVRGLAADHRCDIFALGALLYEMLSGRRAFGGATQMDVMSSILKEDPPDLPSSGERPIPPALVRIIDRCLEKDPPARFQSTRDLAFALEGFSSHSGPSNAIPIAPDRVARRRFEQVAAFVCAAGMLAALPIVVTHLRESPADPDVVRFTVSAPEGAVFSAGPNTGNAYRPAQTVSPDGRHMAFLARALKGPSALYIRSFDSLEVRVLAGTEGANYPFWSPDSRFIAFFAGGKLRRIALSGASLRSICDASAGEGGTWSRDNVILFADSPNSTLMRVAAGGGVPVPATQFDSQKKDAAHKFPQFLPDGRRFIFFAQPANEVRLGSLDSTEIASLLNADSRAMFSPPGYLLFVREGTLMAQSFDPERASLGPDPIPIAGDVVANAANGRTTFSVSSAGILTYREGGAGSTQMTWVDRNGKPLSTIGGRGRHLDVSLSPDGKRATLASFENGAAPDIWVVEDLSRGVRSKFTLDAAYDVQPVWSPDGKRIVFASPRNGQTYDLYVRDSAGARPEEPLLIDSLSKYPFSWSPDGEHVLYASAGSHQNLWTLSLTDRKSRPFMQTAYNEFAGRFSPNGRWVAYRSNESGRGEIYVAPFPGPGGKSLISTGGAEGGYPRWRKDGKELFYLASDQTLMSVAVSEDGDAFHAEPPQPLFPIRTPQSRDPFDVSADGQRFLVLVGGTDNEAEVVTVVFNWAAALRNQSLIPNP